MTDIIKLLENDDQIQFTQDMCNEYNTINNDNDIEKRIAELNATNILLISVEEQLAKQKNDKKVQILKLKNSEEYQEKYSTLTAREEQAKIECNTYNTTILSLQNKQRILQANKQGLEYEIKYLLQTQRKGDS